jgi:hypothetical protein
VQELTCACECRAALVFSVQNWLGESEDSKKKAATSGIFSVGMSGMFLLPSDYNLYKDCAWFDPLVTNWIDALTLNAPQLWHSP